MARSALKPPPDFGFRLNSESGKAVLLIHGMTGAPGEMKFLARRLYRRGLSVAAPLLAGHGIDEAELLKTRWQDWLGSVRRAFEALKADHDEVHVAGICVGGALGLALCAEEPRVASASVYSMTYRYDGWNMKPWNRAITPLIRPFCGLPLVRRLSFTEPYPYGLKDERLRDGMAQAQNAVIPGALDRIPLGAMGQMHALSDHLDRVANRVSQKVLILHATDDDMSHPRNALRLRDNLDGATELHMLDDCYHMIHVDRQRDLVGDLTADFVGAPRAQAARRRDIEAADA
jgi:carboxylesterase